MISGDVLTDIDLGAFVKAHRSAGAAGVDRAEAGREPARVRHRHHPRPTGRSSGSSRSRPGARCSPTRSTPASTCSSPRIFDFIRAGRGRRLLERRVPRGARAGQAPLFGYVVDGYWEDVGTLEAYLRAHQDVLDGGCDVDIDGFRIGEGVWLGEGADVDPDARIDGPGRHRRQLPHRGRARTLREYTVLGTDVVVKHDAFVERSVVPRPRVRRAGGPPARLRHRAVDATSAAARRASRKAWCSATSASSARARSSTRA